MYYCHTRYYVPEWCRWLNADHINYLRLDSVFGANLFAYCDNNPIASIDQTGTLSKKAKWGILGALFAVACIAFVVAASVTTAGAGAAFAVGIVKAASAGFIIGAGGNLIKQTINGNGSLSELDPGQAINSGITGLIAGIIVQPFAAHLGLLGEAAGGQIGYALGKHTICGLSLASVFGGHRNMGFHRK